MKFQHCLVVQHGSTGGERRFTRDMRVVCASLPQCGASAPIRGAGHCLQSCASGAPTHRCKISEPLAVGRMVRRGRWQAILDYKSRNCRESHYGRPAQCADRLLGTEGKRLGKAGRRQREWRRSQRGTGKPGLAQGGGVGALNLLREDVPVVARPHAVLRLRAELAGAGRLAQQAGNGGGKGL